MKLNFKIKVNSFSVFVKDAEFGKTADSSNLLYNVVSSRGVLVNVCGLCLYLF